MLCFTLRIIVPRWTLEFQLGFQLGSEHNHAELKGAFRTNNLPPPPPPSPPFPVPLSLARLYLSLFSQLPPVNLASPLHAGGLAASVEGVSEPCDRGEPSLSIAGIYLLLHQPPVFHTSSASHNPLCSQQTKTSTLHGS